MHPCIHPCQFSLGSAESQLRRCSGEASRLGARLQTCPPCRWSDHECRPMNATHVFRDIQCRKLPARIGRDRNSNIIRSSSGKHTCLLILSPEVVHGRMRSFMVCQGRHSWSRSMTAGRGSGRDSDKTICIAARGVDLRVAALTGMWGCRLQSVISETICLSNYSFANTRFAS